MTNEIQALSHLEPKYLTENQHIMLWGIWQGMSNWLAQKAKGVWGVNCREREETVHCPCLQNSQKAEPLISRRHQTGRPGGRWEGPSPPAGCCWTGGVGWRRAQGSRTRAPPRASRPPTPAPPSWCWWSACLGRGPPQCIITSATKTQGSHFYSIVL